MLKYCDFSYYTYCNLIIPSRKWWSIKLFNTNVCGITCSASARHGKIMGSMLGRGTMVLLPDVRSVTLIFKARLRCSVVGLNHVIAKDVKNFSYCSYVRLRDINCVSKRKVRGLLPCCGPGWLSSSSTATAYRFIQIHIKLFNKNVHKKVWKQHKVHFKKKQ